MATGNIACVATLARAKAQGKKLGRLAGSLVGKQNEKYRRRFDCCRSNYHFSRDVELFHEVEALCANYFFSIVVISYDTAATARWTLVFIFRAITPSPLQSGHLLVWSRTPAAECRAVCRKSCAIKAVAVAPGERSSCHLVP